MEGQYFLLSIVLVLFISTKVQISTAQVSIETTDDPTFTALPESAKCLEDHCPVFRCEEFNDVSVNIFGPKVVTTTAAPPPMMTIPFDENKKFAICYEKMNFKDAYRACCQRNMSLLSIGDAGKYNFLKELFITKMGVGKCLGGPYDNTTDQIFLTSGKYTHCPLQYRWCGSLQEFDYPTGAQWKDNELDDLKTGDIVALRLENGNMELIEVYSNETYKFICESNTPADVAQREAKLKENTHFSCTGPNCQDIGWPCNVPADTATRPALTECKDKKYVFMNKRSNFQRAQDACCRMGMTLVSLDTVDAQSCVVKVLAKESTNINGTLKAWTSGSDLGCTGRFKWCSSGNRIFMDDLRWNSGQQYKKSDYSHTVSVQLSTAKDSLKLNNDWFMAEFPFVCEAPLKEPSDNALLNLIESINQPANATTTAVPAESTGNVVSSSSATNVAHVIDDALQDFFG